MTPQEFDTLAARYGATLTADPGAWPERRTYAFTSTADPATFAVRLLDKPPEARAAAGTLEFRFSKPAKAASRFDWLSEEGVYAETFWGVEALLKALDVRMRNCSATWTPLAAKAVNC